MAVRWRRSKRAGRIVASRSRRVARLLAIPLVFATSVHAVLLATGDGTGNVAAPPDDPGFANVAAAGLSAVYIGNGWVITAAHARLTSVRFDGVFHRFVADSKQRLTNPGSFFRPDLAIWKLYPTPDLAPLRIRETPPEPGLPVILVGHGRSRGEPTTWNGIAGWTWGSERAVRWGTNRVHQTGLDVSVKKTDLTRAFSTRLDPAGDAGATEHEAHVTNGDSGGAAFIKAGDDWELAGALFATTGHPGQPNDLTLYGNVALIGDLSFYRDEILARISQPACSDGLDDDDDGLIDHPADPGCTHPSDNSETADALPCDDGHDNDNDRRVDFPADPGCQSQTDPSES